MPNTGTLAPEEQWKVSTAIGAVLTVFFPLVSYTFMKGMYKDPSYQPPLWLFVAAGAYFFIVTIASYANLRRMGER